MANTTSFPLPTRAGLRAYVIGFEVIPAIRLETDFSPMNSSGTKGLSKRTSLGNPRMV